MLAMAHASLQLFSCRIANLAESFACPGQGRTTGFLKKAKDARGAIVVLLFIAIAATLSQSVARSV